MTQPRDPGLVDILIEAIRDVHDHFEPGLGYDTDTEDPEIKAMAEQLTDEIARVINVLDPGAEILRPDFRRDDDLPAASVARLPSPPLDLKPYGANRDAKTDILAAWGHVIMLSQYDVAAKVAALPPVDVEMLLVRLADCRRALDEVTARTTEAVASAPRLRGLD